MPLTSIKSSPEVDESIEVRPGFEMHGRPRISFLGCRIDDITLSEAVMLSRDAMEKRYRLQHGDFNVAKFIDCKRDHDLLRFAEESDLVCADGMGVVWGSRLLGAPLRERVSGCDFMMRLIDLCGREGFRPYFLGATPEVLEAAVVQARRNSPGLDVAGWHHGYFDRKQELDIVADIRASRADCLFVGISTPIKERFLNQYRDLLNVPVQLGVGGSFDVLAGRVRRAPQWMQRIGLEWFYRFAQEPARLWRRYLFTNTHFAVVMILALADRVRQQLLPQSRQAS